MSAIFCQSCGMPLNDKEVLGTEANGAKTDEYCVYCYENGVYKQPDLTIDEMIDICASYMKQDGMDEDKARAILREQLPTLKRWNKGA